MKKEILKRTLTGGKYHERMERVTFVPDEEFRESTGEEACIDDLHFIASLIAKNAPGGFADYLLSAAGFHYAYGRPDQADVLTILVEKLLWDWSNDEGSFGFSLIAPDAKDSYLEAKLTEETLRIEWSGQFDLPVIVTSEVR